MLEQYSSQIFILEVNIHKKCITEKDKRKKQFQHIDEKREILYNKSV